MPQITHLVHTLKKQLKANGYTYQHVATLLGLSEASVKRLFSDRNFTLDRLEQICHMMGLEISDLFQLMESEQQRMARLTQSQEKEIASDLLLLLVTVCVINGYSFQDLIEQYAIEPTVCIQKLAHLDRLRIIDLLPNNRVKLLIASNFTWLPNGPIQRFFQEKVEKDFFNSKFDKEQEQLVVLNGLLSKASNIKFQEKMRRLANEFNDLSKQDASLSMDQKNGNTVVLAVRQWRYSIFENFRK